MKGRESLACQSLRGAQTLCRLPPDQENARRTGRTGLRGQARPGPQQTDRRTQRTQRRTAFLRPCHPSLLSLVLLHLPSYLVLFRIRSPQHLIHEPPKIRRHQPAPSTALLPSAQYWAAGKRGSERSTYFITLVLVRHQPRTMSSPLASAGVGAGPKHDFIAVGIDFGTTYVSLFPLAAACLV
jgi:hypothetical protein